MPGLSPRWRIDRAVAGFQQAGANRGIEFDIGGGAAQLPQMMVEVVGIERRAVRQNECCCR